MRNSEPKKLNSNLFALFPRSTLKGRLDSPGGNVGLGMLVQVLGLG